MERRIHREVDEMLWRHFLQRGGWSLACEFTEVPDHVHVIVVLG
jgi:hypothetical protein